jgi:hypothetical protein
MAMTSFLRLQGSRPGDYFASPFGLRKVPNFVGSPVTRSYERVKPPPSAVPLAFARGQGVPHFVTPLK